jgi:hypothetical protein
MPFCPRALRQCRDRIAALGRIDRCSVRRRGTVCPEQDRGKCIGTARCSPADAEGCGSSRSSGATCGAALTPDHDAAADAQRRDRIAALGPMDCCPVRRRGTACLEEDRRKCADTRAGCGHSDHSRHRARVDALLSAGAAAGKAAFARTLPLLRRLHANSRRRPLRGSKRRSSFAATRTRGRKSTQGIGCGPFPASPRGRPGARGQNVIDSRTLRSS